MPSRRCVTSRWPVELTGRYSVSPSTRPRISACQNSIAPTVTHCSQATQGQCCSRSQKYTTRDCYASILLFEAHVPLQPNLESRTLSRAPCGNKQLSTCYWP